MAIVRCRSCEAEVRVGFMPASSCGVLVAVPVALTIAVQVVLLDVWGAWSLLACVPVFVAAALLTRHLPASLEWLLAHRRSCASCGGRRWTYPFTKGFGS